MCGIDREAFDAGPFDRFIRHDLDRGSLPEGLGEFDFILALDFDADLDLDLLVPAQRLVEADPSGKAGPSGSTSSSPILSATARVDMSNSSAVPCRLHPG